jgi:hypothetical protein
MATNTTQITPSAVHSVSPAVKVLDCTIAFGDGATKNYVLGTIPAGARVLRGNVIVTTVFNWGTNNLIDIGTAADPDGFATLMSLTHERRHRLRRDGDAVEVLSVRRPRTR